MSMLKPSLDIYFIHDTGNKQKDGLLGLFGSVYLAGFVEACV